MEVHHHPDLHHKQKQWKEYFLEFLLIFLAVTLGFLADNFREHIKDNSEIQNDMQSMVADLQSDVALYDATAAANQLSDRRIDTLISLLKFDRSNTSQIYFLARYITANNNIYTPSTKTFDQMKSSAALKLIQPRSLLDSISDYYQSLQYFPLQNAFQNQKVNNIHSVNSRLFDGYTFLKMFQANNFKSNMTNGIIAMPKDRPVLLTSDFTDINTVIMAYQYLYATTELNNTAAITVRRQAIRLIDLLKKEYDLN
jgi:hypothetical protein